jgi:hypothetical protein
MVSLAMKLTIMGNGIMVEEFEFEVAFSGIPNFIKI